MKEEEPKFEARKTKQIENPEQFLEWIKERSEESDDYVEFYRQAQHKYLDSLLEGKNIDAGNFITQSTIRGEAFKIAAKDDPPLKDFADKLYKEFIEQSKKRQDFGIRTAEDLMKAQKDEKYQKLEEEFDENIRKLLESYKLKVGDYKAEEKLRKYNEVLEKMSYYPGELTGKMKELEEKHGIAQIDNMINYGAANLFAAVTKVAEKMEHELETKLTKEGDRSLEEIEEEIERLFG